MFVLGDLFKSKKQRIASFLIFYFSHPSKRGRICCFLICGILKKGNMDDYKRGHMLTILYEEKKYKIEKEKLIYILEKLEKREVKEEEIKLLMHKYCLYDEVFLKNINKLW